MYLRRIIKKLYSILRNEKFYIWNGNYASWTEAQNLSEGYDKESILGKTLGAVLKVKNGEAIYERDSVIFDKVQYSWPLLATLLREYIKNKEELIVVDFGGSLGSTYFQNKQYLKELKLVKWSVIEQNHYVKVGNEKITDHQLKFHETVEESIEKIGYPNVLILSSVLQYLDNPYEWIDKFNKLKIATIIIDRTAFIESMEDRITIQNVPASIYKASYPAWFFIEDKLIKAFSNYQLEMDFDNGFTPPSVLEDGSKVYWKGLILKKNG